MYDSTFAGVNVPADSTDHQNSVRGETPTTETDYLRDFSSLPPDERAWAASFFGWYRDPTEAEMDEEYQRCLADERRNAEAAVNSVASDTARCEVASSIRPENMATDWLEAAANDPAGNLPVASGESPAAKLAEARAELDRRQAERPEPVVVRETRYIINVGMKGKKYAVAVECPDGRKVKVGTYAREDQAWLAGQRVATELRQDAVAVA